MENQLEKIETTEIHPSEIVYQQDKAQIDVQISTAKHFPRNVQRSINNAIAMVTMDKETASTCTYSLPRGGKPITGASVHLAKILAQVWGNMRVEARVVSIDAKQVTSEAVAFDLENNLAIKTQVKRSIVGKSGVRFSDDMITVTGNASNSIALRNAILSVIPKAIVDKVYNSAKNVITGDVSDEAKLIARRKQIFDGFINTYNVTEAEILKSIGKASITHVTSDDIVVLVGTAQAIKDGETTVEDVFRPKNKVDSKASDKAKEYTRITDHINNSKTLEQLKQISKDELLDELQSKLYEDKEKEFSKA